MLSQTAIDHQVSRQPGVSLLGVLERLGVGPSLAEGLNEPLGFAVGPWRVGPGLNALELEDAARFAKCLVDVGRPVVAHQLTTLDAMTVEPGQSRLINSIPVTFYSSGSTSMYVSRVVSSIPTWTRSYPTPPERPGCRVLVMR